MDAPKEKAKELIEKFIEPTKVPNIKGIWIQDLDGAKQCALIAVDEIIKYQPFDVYTIEQSNNVNKYWQEVKTEIEKL